MRIADFALERYFARYEFTTPHLLCASDVEACSMKQVIAALDDECRAMWEGLTLGYWPATGHPLLRREIAALYDDEIDPDDIVVFTGAQEAIFATMNVLVGAGDHAIVVWPGYQSLYEVARAAGADVALVPLEARDRFRLDLDRVKAALERDTRVVIVNYPHNPTGALLDRASFDQLVGLCEDAGVVLFSDEVYRFLENDERERLPAAATRSKTAVSLGVLSKAFGLGGLRVGWLATRDRELLLRIAKYKDYLSICNSGPSEVLAIGALRDRQRLLARSRGIVAENLGRLDAFIARSKRSVEWVRPRGGSVAFPRLLLSTSIDVVARELVEEEGVLILPGSVYGHADNHFRVGYGRCDLPDALERLERYLARRS
jgi:aspartate/methionine/tyrosine aminotransferase